MKTIIRAAVLLGVVAGSPQVVALNIVLSNDDGWSGPGVQAMKRALVTAGHKVYLAAPLDEQSGSSAAINRGRLEVVKQRDLADEGALEFSVALPGGTEGAEPATAAMVGVGIAQHATGAAPDLLVSGINTGQNLGAATQISGTVGAAIAAISTGLGGAQIPAIAISTDEPCDPEKEAEKEEECAALNSGQYERVAAFVAGLIARLSADRSAPLMPVGVALNINYPPVHPVNGARISRQGRTLAFGPGPLSITYGCFADCVAAPKGQPLEAGNTGFLPLEMPEVPDADTTNNRAGYITVVPIVADYTAGARGPSDPSLSAFRSRLAAILRAMDL